MKKISMFIIMALLVLTFSSCKDNSKNNDGFILEEFLEKSDNAYDERRQYLIDYFLTYRTKDHSSKTGFGATAVQFYMYEKTQEQSYLDSALKQTYNVYKGMAASANCFSISNAVFHYGLFSKYYSQELLEYSKEVICNSPAYGDEPHTPNHGLMGAVGSYLANQYFPGEIKTEFYGYPEKQTNDPTGEKAIKKILNIYPYHGVVEANSDTYFYTHIFPLMALWLCATDDEMSNSSYLVMENALFTVAPIWLEGHMAISPTRTYTPIAGQNYTGESGIMLWYYFGGADQYPSKSEMDYMETYALGFLVYLDYRPHWIASAIATDRTEEYTHQEMHIHRVDRWERTMISYMQSKMNENYSIFSAKRTFIGGGTYEHAYNGYFQHSLNWAVRWTDEENPSNLTTFSIQHLNNVYGDKSAFFGSSAYMQVFQYEKTIIGVFDVPSDHKLPNIVIYQPETYKAIIDESYAGRVYIHYGNIIIAYSLSFPFLMDVKDNVIHTSNITKAYFVCEVLESKDVEGDTYEEQLMYAQSLVESGFRKIESDFTDNTYINYSSYTGNTLSMNYDGYYGIFNETVNGELMKYNFATYPVQSNPWVSQSLDDKTITYTYKGYSVTFDFETFSKYES